MTATLNEARERVYQTWNTGWGATTTWARDNINFTPPSNTSWARLSVRHLPSDVDSMGAVGDRKFLRTAMVLVQLFVPLDSNVQDADTLSTTARDLFEGKTLTPENLWFTAVDSREIGPTDDGWFQVNVEATFNYIDRK